MKKEKVIIVIVLIVGSISMLGAIAKLKTNITRVPKENLTTMIPLAKTTVEPKTKIIMEETTQETTPEVAQTPVVEEEVVVEEEEKVMDPESVALPESDVPERES